MSDFCGFEMSVCVKVWTDGVDGLYRTSFNRLVSGRKLLYTLSHLQKQVDVLQALLPLCHKIID